MQGKYGWKKDTRKPDSVTNYHKRRLAVVPAAVEWSAYIPKIGNQDGVGECTGFGFSEYIATYAAQKGMIQPHMDIFDSANWLYNGARKMEGTLHIDNGAYPDDVADWFVNNGGLLWTVWPFKDVLDETDPAEYAGNAILYANRIKYRVADGVDSIVSAIAEGYVVAIGTPWPYSWESYSSGVLPEINKDSLIAGGHETLLWGYQLFYNTDGTINYSKSYFFGSNSWGTNWGILISALGTTGGYKMPMSAFNVFKQIGGYDAHYITFGAAPNPPEPPTPTPSHCSCSGSSAKMMTKITHALGGHGQWKYV